MPREHSPQKRGPVSQLGGRLILPTRPGTPEAEVTGSWQRLPGPAGAAWDFTLTFGGSFDSTTCGEMAGRLPGESPRRAAAWPGDRHGQECGQAAPRREPHRNHARLGSYVRVRWAQS